MKLKTAYKRYQTDPGRVAFLLEVLKQDKVGYTIEKVNKTTYSIGPMWDKIEFPERLFDLLKPHLKIEKEYDEGRWYTYWELK